jgi:CRP/FNR family transcriptional regulator
MLNTNYPSEESIDANSTPNRTELRERPINAASPSPMKYEAFKVACSSCNLRELCLPVGLSQPQLSQLDSLVSTRKAVKRGDALFHTGDPFRSVYAVRTGFFKTRVSSEDGRDQVTGFQMAGELLGLDGISTDNHACDAIALEDSQVCVIPYAQLEELSRESALVLRMTREEIGSYLGLKLETVSRTFSKFQDDGLLEVKQRDIRILNEQGLRTLINTVRC